MATLEDIRRQFPQTEGLSDSEIITRMSEAGGLDPKYVAGRLGVDVAPDGFKSGFKRGIAGMVGGVGEVVGDVTGRHNNALTRFAKDVEFSNPSEINSIQDVIDKPGLAVRSAMGNAASFLIPGGGLKLGAAGLRGMKAVNAARALDNPVTQAALAGLPSLGEIGDTQRTSGEGENLALKYLGAGAVGAIENMGGLQRVLGFGGQRAARTVAQEAAEMGKTPWRTALKATGRMMGQEGLEEVAQTPIEQMAGYRNPTSQQALEETALGGVMGTLGGVIGAGHGAAQGVRHARIQRGIATDMLDPSADYGRRRELGEFNQAFMARDTGPAAAQQWFDEFNQGAIADRDAGNMAAYRQVNDARMNDLAAQQMGFKDFDDYLAWELTNQPTGTRIGSMLGMSPEAPLPPGVVSQSTPIQFTNTASGPVYGPLANNVEVPPTRPDALGMLPANGQVEASPIPFNPAPVENPYVGGPLANAGAAPAARPDRFGMMPSEATVPARSPIPFNPVQGDASPAYGAGASRDQVKTDALGMSTEAYRQPASAPIQFSPAPVENAPIAGPLGGFQPGQPSPKATAMKQASKAAQAAEKAAPAPKPAKKSQAIIKLQEQIDAMVTAGELDANDEVLQAWAAGPQKTADVEAVRRSVDKLRTPKVADQILAERAKPVAKADAAVSAVDSVRGALTDKQRKVFDHLMEAVRNDQIDSVVDSEGKFKYAEIGKALGLARGSAKSFIDQTAKRIAASQGVSVDELKAGLRERAKRQRATEEAAQSKLGASPAEQESHFDEGALFGNDAGAEATAGVIDSVGGSQSDIGEGGVDPEKVAPATETRDVKRAEREAADLKAKQEAADQEAAKIEARRRAEAEAQRTSADEATVEPKTDDELFANQKDWAGNPIKLVDVEDAVDLWNEKADGLPLEGARRVQFVKAYIAWTDGELSDRQFFETLFDVADAVATEGQSDVRGLHRDSGEVQGEAQGAADLRGVTDDRTETPDEGVIEPTAAADKALQGAVAAKIKQHGAAKYSGITQQLRDNGVAITPETQLMAFKLYEDNGTLNFSPEDIAALKVVAGDENVSPEDVDFDAAPSAPETTSARRIEPAAGRRTYVRAMVGLRSNLPKSPALDTDLRENLLAGNVKGALDAIAEGGSSVATRQLAKKLSGLMTDAISVEIVEPGKYYPEGVPNLLASAYGVAELDRDNKHVKVYLRSDVGVNEETTLHELLHAALQARYDFLEYNAARGKAGEAAIARFNETWKAFQAEVEGNDELPVGVREAARSPDEFITYALTNPETQAWMQARRYRGQTLWERFKNFVASVLGFGTPPSWLDAAMRVSNEVLEGAAKDEADFSASDALKGNQTAARAIDVAEKMGGPTAVKAVIDTTDTIRKLGDSMLFLHDLVDKYKYRLPSAGAWYKAVQGSIARKHQLEQDAEQIATRAAKLDTMDRVNDFISRSTFEQKWGYDATFDGVNGPKSVKANPAMAAEFKELSADEQQVVKDVFAHGEKMATAKFNLLKDMGLASNNLLTMGKLEGPYAPLKRFGNYVSVGKSQQLVDLESKRTHLVNDGKPTTQVDKQIRELKAKPEHYIVSYHATPGLAWETAKGRAGQYAFTDSFEKSARVDEHNKLPEDVFQKILAAVKAEDLPGEVKTAMRGMVEQLYAEAIDEHNARAAGLKRENRAGYDPDMMKAFLSHARAEANFLANIEFGSKMNEQFFAMQNEAKDAGGKRSAQDAFNEFGKHYAENLTYRDTPWQDRAMALTSAWQLATSVGYHVTNATQGIMVTVPKLAADFGDYAGAWRHLMDGYRTLAKVGVKDMDFTKVSDAGLREALQRASDMGVLDVGMDEDLTQFDVLRTGYAGVDKASVLARKALHMLRQMSRWVETANRVSAATAAYRMAREKGRSVEAAQDYAVKILQSTQGDFSRVGSPLLLKKLPKPMTQYRKYQFMMGALYAKAFNDAFAGADADTKAVGRRMLKYKLAHTAFAAGALGLPLMNLAGLVFAASGDDEPRDLERWLRDAIDDETLADLLLHGVPAMAGIDMHAKLGDDKVFSITPYTDWDVSSREGFAKTIVGFMGPAASQGATFADGIGKMQEGDYYKGLEQFMPRGIKDGMAAFRMANEGYTLTNGDVLVGPDDISGFSLAMSALGMPSTEIQQIKWLRGQQYEAKQFFTDRSREIQREYARAYESGDDATLAELQDQWLALQDGKDRVRPYFNDSPDELKRQALSTLIKYPRKAAERERKLQATVPE